MATKQIGIQGETLKLFFKYTLNDVPIEELSTAPANIECQILDEGAVGAIKLTKTGGRISIPSGGTYYEATLTQAETFALPQTVKYQFKILDTDGNAIADDVGVFTLGKALSKTTLT